MEESDPTLFVINIFFFIYLKYTFINASVPEPPAYTDFRASGMSACQDSL